MHVLFRKMFVLENTNSGEPICTILQFSTVNSTVHNSTGPENYKTFTKFNAQTLTEISYQKADC